MNYKKKKLINKGRYFNFQKICEGNKIFIRLRIYLRLILMMKILKLRLFYIYLYI